MATQTWLTCEFVEDLQQVAHAGKSSARYVDPLEEATLPALLEYGCARWHNPSLTTLPPRVFDSPLGRALQEVRSDIGLRTAGRQKRPPRTMTPLPHEFYVLEGDAPTTEQEWDEFLVRFRQSVKNVGFDPKRALSISAALGEMADNAAIHANTAVGVVVGYQAVEGACVCCVADVGIGVFASLTSHDAYRHTRSHKDAIRLSLQQGVSRLGPGEGGFGFNSVFKALASMSGTLRFRSGEGCVTMDGTGLDVDTGADSYVTFRPGFQVTICCRTSDRADRFPLV